MSTLTRSYIAAICAFVLFGSTSLVVKGSSLTVPELIFGRMAITAALLAPISWKALKESRSKMSRRVLGFTMATSAAIFLNMILLFWAFRLAPISVCVAIFYSGPIISLLLQHLLKQRKMSRVESAILAAASLTIVTMIVFATPGVPGSNHVLGYALAFGGGILFGLIPLLQIGTRSLPNSVTLLIQSAFAALCLLPFSLGIFSVTAMKSVFELAILGILFTLVPFCLWWQALRENAKLNPFVSYLDPMTAILISVFVFKEYPGWVEATGAFVLGGCALIAMSAQKSNRSEEGVDSSSAP